MEHRREIVFAGIDTTGRGLEIGAGHQPLAPKSEGFNVATLDHVNQEDLKLKLKQRQIAPELIDQVEHVDYVWTGGPYTDLVDERFDFVLASHLIEHTVDLVTFLQDCQSLLKPGGALSLIIPDKRYCFDAMRPPTTLGQVIDRHRDDTKYHTPGTIIDHHAYAVRDDERTAWSAATNSGNLTLLNDTLGPDLPNYRESLAQQRYQDCHHWQFTPMSFRLLIHDLNVMGFTDFVYTTGHDTVQSEFFATLRIGDVTDEPMTRNEMLRVVRDELGAGLVSSANVATEIERLKKERDKMTHSLSWRVTAPLRKVSRRVRR